MLLAACDKTTPTAVIPTIEPTAETPPTKTLSPDSLLVVDPGGIASQDVLDSLQTFGSTNELFYATNADLNTDMTGVKIAVVFGDAQRIQGTDGFQFRHSIPVRWNYKRDRLEEISAW